jgi:selenocysteine-specific elongation factor
MLQALERSGPLSTRDLISASGLGDTAPEALTQLLNEGQAILLARQPGAQQPFSSNQLVAARTWWSATTEQIASDLAAHHGKFPLRVGMGREALRSGLRLEAKVFNAVMARAAAEGLVSEEGAVVRLPSHTVTLKPGQQRQVDELLARFRSQPYTTPSFKESVAMVGEEVLSVLISRGDLVQVSSGVLFLSKTYEELEARIRTHLERQGSITLAQTRDMLKTSRKYAQALLEHLDEIGVTKRTGDERVLQQKP